MGAAQVKRGDTQSNPKDSACMGRIRQRQCLREAQPSRARLKASISSGYSLQVVVRSHGKKCRGHKGRLSSPAPPGSLLLSDVVFHHPTTASLQRGIAWRTRLRPGHDTDANDSPGTPGSRIQAVQNQAIAVCAKG